MQREREREREGTVCDSVLESVVKCARCLSGLSALSAFIAFRKWMS